MPALSAHYGQRAAEFHCVVWSRRMSAPRSDRRTGSDEPLRVAVPGELSRSGDRVSTCLGSRPIGPSGFDAYRRLAIDQPLLRGDLLVSRRLYGRAERHGLRPDRIAVSIPVGLREEEVDQSRDGGTRQSPMGRWDEIQGTLIRGRRCAIARPEPPPGGARRIRFDDLIAALTFAETKPRNEIPRLVVRNAPIALACIGKLLIGQGP